VRRILHAARRMRLLSCGRGDFSHDQRAQTRWRLRQKSVGRRLTGTDCRHPDTLGYLRKVSKGTQRHPCRERTDSHTCPSKRWRSPTSPRRSRHSRRRGASAGRRGKGAECVAAVRRRVPANLGRGRP
jgi:hypothetical protein